MTGNTHCTAVLNRAKIQAPIFPTDSIKCTNGVDRTEIVELVSTPIIQHNTEETVVPCITTFTEITEITNSTAPDNEDYLSDVEINESSIVSTLPDIQLPSTISTASTLQSSINLSHINIMDTIHDSQLDDTTLTLLNTEIEDDDFDDVLTALQQSTCLEQPSH